MMDMIVKGAARAMFVSWWADQCSCGFDYETCRLGGDGHEDWDPSVPHIPNDPGGVELMDIAPETPVSALDEAECFIRCVAGDNRSLWTALTTEDEDEDDPAVLACRTAVLSDPKGFGHYLAMEAMGHGVAWSDDHEDHGLKLPCVEYMGYYIGEGK